MSFGSDYRINRRAALGTLSAVVLPGAFSLPAHAASRAATWPSWRGPTANGVADGVSLPTRWSRTSNVRWSVELPGWGTSSPVIFGDRLFVTTQLEQAGVKSLLTMCFHRDSGKELWRHDFGFGVDQRTHEGIVKLTTRRRFCPGKSSQVSPFQQTHVTFFQSVRARSLRSR